jgi:hypothetical protein
VNANASTPGPKNSISKLSVDDGLRLSNQLVQALFGGCAVAALPICASRFAPYLLLDAIAKAMAQGQIANPVHQ